MGCLNLYFSLFLCVHVCVCVCGSCVFFVYSASLRWVCVCMRDNHHTKNDEIIIACQTCRAIPADARTHSHARTLKLTHILYGWGANVLPEFGARSCGFGWYNFPINFLPSAYYNMVGNSFPHLTFICLFVSVYVCMYVCISFFASICWFFFVCSLVEMLQKALSLT